ncbi:hypothetical protein D9M69_599740 [compost metagenome]
MPAAVVMATVAEPVATRISAATSQPSSSGERSKRADSPTISRVTPVSMRIRLSPPPAPTSKVMAAVGARHSLLKRRIASRLKPRARPRVQKLTRVAISRAITELPMKCSVALMAVPGGAMRSAQPPSSISTTGSSMVPRVMPKPGRLVGRSWDSVNCVAIGL